MDEGNGELMSLRDYQNEEVARAVIECRNKEGIIEAQTLVEKARAKNHVLHPYFCWDDTVAAARYRVVQARGIIRTVKVNIIPSPQKKGLTGKVQIKTIRATQSRVSIRGKKGNYETVQDIVSDKRKKAEILEMAKIELIAFKKRYEGLVELAGVISAIDELI